jgi:hypothetical protein
MIGIVDILGALAAFGGIVLLSKLDAHPMGEWAGYAGFADIHFYSPPLAGVACIMFDAKSFPALLKITRATVGCGALAVFIVRMTMELGLAKYYIRAAAVAGSFLFMKVSGFFYPVGGAIAVLFVDKASEWDSKLGYGYAIMPGLTGTYVLAVLAALKIALANALELAFQPAAKASKETKKKK